MGAVITSEHADSDSDNVTCKDITEHIAQETRSNLTKNITANKSHIPVLIDESA